jgi:hypothetical protein
VLAPAAIALASGRLSFLICGIPAAEAAIATDHRAATGFDRVKRAILLDTVGPGIYPGTPSPYVRAASARRFETEIKGRNYQTTDQK